ncbi:MAG TPA: GNAT family N-acetyltransferase [Trueperaceae bacterium]
MALFGQLPFTVREFDRIRDYPGRAEVHNASYPDRPVTVEELKTWDESNNPDPKYLNRHFVAELEDGRIAAHLWYGHWPGMYHPQKLYFSLAVHPDFRRRGIGSALYEKTLAEITPHDPIRLTNVAYENQPDGLKFLRQRGFEERMRFWESYLDVQKFDPAPYERVIEKVAAGGIVIRSEADLAGEADFERKLYEMLNEITMDVPVPDPFTPEPFERFVENRRKSINRIPEAYFIAIDSETGRYAGTSALWKSHAAAYLKTGLTGVRREYRRRGIALALKLRGIEYARQVGAPGIKTDNESGNRPMLSINEMLGFERGTAEIDMSKKLK